MIEAAVLRPPLDSTPTFDVDSARRLAHMLYGVEAAAEPLTSERDQNFLIRPRDGAPFVLKVANAAEPRGLLEAEQLAMTRLADAGVPVPRPLATTTGATLTEITAADGRRHLAWAVSWLPGELLGIVHHRSPALLRDLGRTVGSITAALASFDHPAIHRDFYWDLAHARRIIAGHRAMIDDESLAATVDAVVRDFDRYTAPVLDGLRRSAVHNDLNDYNILVGDGTDLETRNQRVVGVVDFGDMVHSYAIGDLAIAIAYAVFDAGDPLSAAAEVVRGYTATCAPTETEIAALHGLVTMRLCASVCIAAEQVRQRPENQYLSVSQESIARALPQFAAVPFKLAEAVYRDACGLPAAASSARVVDWLRSRTARAAPIIDVDLRTAPSIVLDLSITSLLVDDPNRIDEPALTARIFSAMQDAGVKVAIGRYDEPRLLYQAPAFGTGGPMTDERRMLHIGLDLFGAAGTPVYAPLAGTVHMVADNDAPQDYGPVIVLRHETDDGTEFFTLYGHLSRQSLARMAVGDRIEAGQQIATFGVAAENGGWTPHLHFQIITDLLDMGRDFPGVGRVSQRAVWTSLSPDPNLLAGVPMDHFPPPGPSKAQTLDARRRSIGGNLSIAYRDPVKIVRGWRQHLFDDDGRRYIDAYNNVPHVGHCHPRVVEAAHAQMRLLNTNTRYLSDLLVEYADRLTSTLPAPLGVAYFVNSASEANELALRLTRAYTGRRDMIVLDAAYHGNTTSLIDISPYKHAGPGGTGAPEWVHVAPLPDDYRGPYKRADPEAGRKYARQVGEIIDRVGAVGGFIAETAPSVGGQLMLPGGYLSDVYTHVRAAGGVCIADEVQTGLGRMGTHFWAFEAHAVVPDIVVMGKPLGNGHPIAAVVTTPAIAGAFDNGMEFFSTYGGNNVSCAVGLAVLDVLRDEGLQAHARQVGERLLRDLRTLHQQYDLIGDVRGSGFFLGVELVRDRETLEPAGEEASFVVNRMREQGVLVGTDGPYHNVVKIRPPMPFDVTDAGVLVRALASSLDILA